MAHRVPYVAVINTEGPRSHSAGEKTEFHDIFDPAVQSRLRAKVRDAARRNADNRFCLGYVFIDLPVWSAQPRTGEAVTNLQFLRIIPGSPMARKPATRLNPTRFAHEYPIHA